MTKIKYGSDDFDCVCLVGVWEEIRVHVTGVHHWVRNNWAEDQGYFDEDDYDITELRVDGNIVTEKTLSVVTGLSEDDIDSSLEWQILHFLETGEDSA